MTSADLTHPGVAIRHRIPRGTTVRGPVSAHEPALDQVRDLLGSTLVDVDTQPVTVSLQNLAGSFAAQYNVQLAGALIAAVPTLLVYILLGRYFVRGLLAGSLKG